MAHFCVLVVTRGPDNVAGALKPFQIAEGDSQEQPHFSFVEDAHADLDPRSGRRGYWRNPTGQWDGWMLGGRWSGLLGDGDWSWPGQSPREAAENQRRRRALEFWLEQRQPRLNHVYALLAGGRWHDVREPRASAFQDFLVQELRKLDPETWVSVVDCHS